MLTAFTQFLPTYSFLELAGCDCSSTPIVYIYISPVRLPLTWLHKQQVQLDTKSRNSLFSATLSYNILEPLCVHLRNILKANEHGSQKINRSVVRQIKALAMQVVYP